MAVSEWAAKEMQEVETMALSGQFGDLYQLRVITSAPGGFVVIESNQDDLTDYHDAWVEVLG